MVSVGTGRLAHTYSIVARDPSTGEMGAAVQSHWFSVGSVVTWGEAGVGVVATQSLVNPAFGPGGLRLLRSGRSPEEAVREMIEADEAREVRQLAVLDTSGRAFAFTGRRCIPKCGHITRDNLSVQANTMASKEVWPAMARAFEGTGGRLAERMVAALEAAEGEGGDYRGRQSAALLVVKGTPSGRCWEDRRLDLGAETLPDPAGGLGGFLKGPAANGGRTVGALALEKGDMAAAMEHYGLARSRCPENEEMMFWHAAMLANNGRWDEALPLFSKAFTRNHRWREAVPDLARLGHLRLSPEQVDLIIKL